MKFRPPFYKIGHRFRETDQRFGNVLRAERLLLDRTSGHADEIAGNADPKIINAALRVSPRTGHLHHPVYHLCVPRGDCETLHAMACIGVNNLEAFWRGQLDSASQANGRFTPRTIASHRPSGFKKLTKPRILGQTVLLRPTPKVTTGQNSCRLRRLDD